MPRRRALRMLAAGAGVALVGGLRPAVARAEGCGDQAANCQRQGKDFCGGERLAGCLYTCCDPGEECCTASDRYGVVGAGCCPVDTRCGDGGYPGCVCKIPCDPEGRRCCSVKDQEVCMPSTEANEGQVCCPPERRCNEKCCPEGEECIRGECTPYCRNERGRGVTRVYDPKTECCTEHGIEQKYPIRNYARCRKTRVPRKGYKSNGRGRCGPDDGPEVPQGYRAASFRAACRAHDKCYDTCRSDRSECDEKFAKRVKRACTSTYPTPGLNRSRCLRRANLYSDAVVALGSIYYADAQSKACQCCP